MFSVSALYLASVPYLPSAFGLGQILGTSAKYQGGYWKHQVILSIYCIYIKSVHPEEDRYLYTLLLSVPWFSHNYDASSILIYIDLLVHPRPQTSFLTINNKMIINLLQYFKCACRLIWMRGKLGNKILIPKPKTVSTWSICINMIKDHPSFHYLVQWIKRNTP